MFLKNLCLSGVLVASSLTASADMPRSEAVTLEISRAYGFVLAQKITLDRIAKQYPDLSTMTFVAEKEFDLTYSGIRQAADDYFAAIPKAPWAKIKSDLQAQMLKQLPERHSREVALGFINEVQNERTKGINVPSPIYETLLYLQPRHQSNPAREFTSGHTFEYNSTGHPKAQGLDIRLELPASWEASEGVRPQIVQRFKNYNGHGLEMVMLMVHDMGVGPVDVTPSDLPSKVDRSVASEFLPDGALFIAGGSVIVDQLPGLWFHYDLTSQYGRNTLTQRVLSYMLFYKGKMISLQMTTALDMNGEPTNGTPYKTMEPLFDLIANSFTLLDQY